VPVTHWGLSGPAILRLSAWGARQLHAGYRLHAHGQLGGRRARRSRPGPSSRRSGPGTPSARLVSSTRTRSPSRRGSGSASPPPRASAAGRPGRTSRRSHARARGSSGGLGVRRGGKEHEQGGVRHLRRRQPRPGEHGDHGEPHCARVSTSRARSWTSTGSRADTTSSRPGRRAGRRAGPWHCGERSSGTGRALAREACGGAVALPRPPPAGSLGDDYGRFPAAGSGAEAGSATTGESSPTFAQRK
jgi:hypothetical protein